MLGDARKLLDTPLEGRARKLYETVLRYNRVLVPVAIILFVLALGRVANAAYELDNTTWDAWDYPSNTQIVNQSDTPLSNTAITSFTVYLRDIYGGITCTDQEARLQFDGDGYYGAGTWQNCTAQTIVFTSGETKIVTFDCSNLGANDTWDNVTGFAVYASGDLCNNGEIEWAQATTNQLGCAGASCTRSGNNNAYDQYIQAGEEDPDPREDPTATIDEPDDEDEISGVIIPLVVVSDVDHDDYADENPTLYLDLEWWDGDSWEEEGSESVEWDNGPWGTLSSGDNYYQFGGSDDTGDLLTIVVDSWGLYRIRAALQFEGQEMGDWSSYNEFYALYPFGGGGGGSWEDDDGGLTDWDDILDDQWALKPTCTVFGSSLFWESGGSSGTGIACVGEWVRFMLLPEAEGFFDYVQLPLTTMQTRWPFNYVTETWESVTTGFWTNPTCPLGSIGGGTHFGTALPSLDLCDWFDDIEDEMSDQSSFQTIIVYGIWAMLALYAFKRAVGFLTNRDQTGTTPGL